MRYKVPQDVQREDKILFFITLRQLIILMVGGGISYWLYIVVNQYFIISEVETVLILIPALISAAIAFLRVKSVSLFQFFLLLLEMIFYRPVKRYWVQGGGDVFVSMTATTTQKKKKKNNEKIPEKNVSQEKIKNLAALLDNQQSDFQKNNKSPF